VRALFAIGVQGYLLKSASGNELIAAVHAVQRGEQVLSAEIAAQLASKTRRAGVAATDELTDREREVLVLVAQGKSNRDIAQALQVRPRTAETHVSNIMAKLGAGSRSDAIGKAVQRGLIAPPEY